MKRIREEYWRAAFERFADQYDEDHEIAGWSKDGLKLRMECYFRQFQKCRPAARSLVLDIGCGSGAYSRCLAQMGYRVVGVDFSKKALLKAKQKSGSLKIDYVVADANHLPFKNSCAAHILCIGVLQSLSETQAVFSEFRRILKQNAYLAATALNSLEILNVFNRLLRRVAYIDKDCKCIERLVRFSPFALKEIGKKHAFKAPVFLPIQIYPAKLSCLKRLFNFWNTLPLLPFLTAHAFFLWAKKV